MFFKFILILLFFGFLLVGFNKKEGGAGEGRWVEPWKDESFPASGKVRNPEKTPSPGEMVVQGLIGFFQTYISPVDGDRCPSYPTCSHYAFQAVRKHGALVGMVMGFGRLIHESDEIQRAPMIWINNSYRSYDPVENNDFWWYKKLGNR
ncbi:MAG: membrane protein insertion efficiency factor YidD [Proteobacteria bacterium]|nr:membrane protein insertion efficiency factor YidD [Pseudomonadota bacterium]